MRLSSPSPVLEKNRAPMGPEIISSTGAGVWRKAAKAFPDSRSVLDRFQSVNIGALRKGPPFHGSRSSKEIKIWNANCQMGGREVTR